MNMHKLHKVFNWTFSLASFFDLCNSLLGVYIYLYTSHNSCQGLYLKGFQIQKVLYDCFLKEHLCKYTRVTVVNIFFLVLIFCNPSFFKISAASKESLGLQILERSVRCCFVRG